MALINCKECEKQISDKAEACPDCGCPFKEQQSAETAETPIICDNCKTQNDVDMVFCQNCGTTLAKNATPISHKTPIAHSIIMAGVSISALMIVLGVFTMIVALSLFTYADEIPFAIAGGIALLVSGALSLFLAHIIKNLIHGYGIIVAHHERRGGEIEK